MVVELKRTVAYICPVCSNISSKYLTIFDFSGAGKATFVCPTHGCREKCVTISVKGAGYKINVECPLCGGNHSYTSSRGGFWKKKLLSYKCPAAGMDIFFAGESDKVEQALEDTDIYSDIIDEYDTGDDAVFNTLLLIIERLNKLSDSHRISCVCGGDRASVIVKGGSVVISCLRCGRSKTIAATEDNLTRVLNSDRIVIGN